MSVRVYNTLTRQKEELAPLVPGKVGMYVCGPTVYDMAHVGHARSCVAFDLIVRHLRRRFDVNYVRNYTDVDDKIIKRANELGKNPRKSLSATSKSSRATWLLSAMPSPTMNPR